MQVRMRAYAGLLTRGELSYQADVAVPIAVHPWRAVQAIQISYALACSAVPGSQWRTVIFFLGIFRVVFRGRVVTPLCANVYACTNVYARGVNVYARDVYVYDVVFVVVHLLVMLLCLCWVLLAYVAAVYVAVCDWFVFWRFHIALVLLCHPICVIQYGVVTRVCGIPFERGGGCAACAFVFRWRLACARYASRRVNKVFGLRTSALGVIYLGSSS